MKKLTLEQWEKKYIAGPVKRFDQKYTMFARPDWDMELRKRLKDWTFMGIAKDKPGYRLEDIGLRRATGTALMMLNAFNVSQPNSHSQAKAVVGALLSTLPFKPPPKPPEGTKANVTNTQKITAIVKKVARYFGADIIGICKLDHRWVYSHSYEFNPFIVGATEKPMGIHKVQEIPDEYQFAIVMGFSMDYNFYKYYNTSLGGAPTGLGYAQMGFTNLLVSEYIRNLGFNAIDCTTNDVALTIPMAIQAGLGELGRNGLLISPWFGPRLRISKIITDLPLVPDTPIDFGVTDFCNVCKKCADMCPLQSIIQGDRTTEPLNVSNNSGVLKWPINAEGCRMYWAQVKRGGGCSTCIAVCPYNKVNTLPHRTVRWMSANFSWLNSFFVKMDDLFGYGKPKNPERFWEEWRPGKEYH